MSRTFFIALCVPIVSCGPVAERDDAAHEATPTPAAASAAALAPESAAVRFVGAFYTAYAPRGAASGLAAVDSLLHERPRLFTPELLDALRRDASARAGAKQEIDGLDFEPFLNSQDPCERYEVGVPTRAGQHVRVPVYAVCDGHRADGAAVVAEVAPANGTWAFANFIYGPPTGDLMRLLRALHP